jgi:hypothetical protein
VHAHRHAAGVAVADLDVAIDDHGRAHEAHRAHLLDGLVGELAAFIELGRDGRNLLLRKVAGRVADHLVFVREWKNGRLAHPASVW